MSENKTSYEQAKGDLSHLGVLIIIYFVALITILPLAKWLFVFANIDDDKRDAFLKATFTSATTYLYLIWIAIMILLVHSAYTN
jgi:hypothetical protein